ncbi:MAG: hypothetical protein KGL39_51045 [Patescibacteria group bacterium]|nr:hypothetical protein [Patescibacteria group bacterium]
MAWGQFMTARERLEHERNQRLKPPTWRERLKHAAAYIETGNTDLYLGHGDEEDLPWEHCNNLGPIGSHRLEINTDVWFEADVEGLHFRWTFDIEPHSANGSGSYEIDVAGCQRVLALLPPATRQKFRAYLAECAAAVAKKAEEWQRIADSQRRAAEFLVKAGAEVEVPA